jgi:hypothetical protein
VRAFEVTRLYGWSPDEWDLCPYERQEIICFPLCSSHFEDTVSQQSASQKRVLSRTKSWLVDFTLPASGKMRNTFFNEPHYL